MTADGHVPVAVRCTDGNVTDSRTDVETWNTFTLYFLAFLVQALIELELRLAMTREKN